MSQTKSPKSNSSNTYMLNHPVRLEQTPRWVRVKIGDELVADSKRTLLLLEYGPGRLPSYYFQEEDVRMDLLHPIHLGRRDSKTKYWSVKSETHVAEAAAWCLVDLPNELAALKGLITFKWGKPIRWYEEEEEVVIHARDPHKRVDVIVSSRHVRIEIGDQTVADTHNPFLLFETSLPTRYYIPRKDVRIDLLQPSDHTSYCPYKGKASYWSVKVGNHLVENIVWSYLNPIPECLKVKELFCFFNEKVNVYLDSELEHRPITPFS